MHENLVNRVRMLILNFFSQNKDTWKEEPLSRTVAINLATNVSSWKSRETRTRKNLYVSCIMRHRDVSVPAISTYPRNHHPSSFLVASFFYAAGQSSLIAPEIGFDAVSLIRKDGSAGVGNEREESGRNCEAQCRWVVLPRGYTGHVAGLSRLAEP